MSRIAVLAMMPHIAHPLGIGCTLWQQGSLHSGRSLGTSATEAWRYGGKIDVSQGPARVSVGAVYEPRSAERRGVESAFLHQAAACPRGSREQEPKQGKPSRRYSPQTGRRVLPMRESARSTTSLSCQLARSRYGAAEQRQRIASRALRRALCLGLNGVGFPRDLIGIAIHFQLNLSRGTVPQVSRDIRGDVNWRAARQWELLCIEDSEAAVEVQLEWLWTAIVPLPIPPVRWSEPKRIELRYPNEHDRPSRWWRGDQAGLMGWGRSCGSRGRAGEVCWKGAERAGEDR